MQKQLSPEPVWDKGTVGDLTKRFRLAIKNKSASTQRNYAKGLVRFHSLMHLMPTEVTKKLALACLHGVPDASQYMAISALSSMFSWAVREEEIETNPILGISRPSYGEWEAITSEELDKILKASQPLLKSMILAAALTGQRRSDLIKAKLKDYDRDQGLIWFTQSKTGTKVGAPVSKDLKKVLDWLDKVRPVDSKVLFTSPSGMAWTVSQLDQAWRRAKIKAGVDKPFHGLRKHRAIKLAEAGASIPELMATLGHTDARMSAHYVSQANQTTLAINAAARLEK